jgi:hypothetical protein
LRKYLYDQQIAALVGVTPGAAAQRAHINGAPSYGAVNSSNFVRAQAQSGFDALPLDALDVLLAGPGGNVDWKAWISAHHFLTWRGHGSVDGATWKSISGEIVVEYSADAWAGTLCKLLPANWRTYMPAVQDNLGTEINCWARMYNTYDDTEHRWVMPVRVAYNNPYPTGDSRLPYQKTWPDHNPQMANGGDSGSPVFCGINGNLIILGHTAWLGNICSHFYADYITQINAAMAALNASGSYSVGTVDLSGFTAY